MKRIKIVMARHYGSDWKYIFGVPKNMEVKRGDILLVNTTRGKQYAKAVTDIMEVTEEDVVQFGAYLPVKYVLERTSKEMCNYIKERTIQEMARSISASVRTQDMENMF